MQQFFFILRIIEILESRDTHTYVLAEVSRHKAVKQLTFHLQPQEET